MYDNNLSHAPASNQVTHVLLAGFPMSSSPIHVISTSTLAEDHLYSSCYVGTQVGKILIDPFLLIKSHHIKYYAHNRVKGLIILSEVTNI